MQISNHVNVLVDFASQMNFSHHCYVEKTANGFVLTKNKTSFTNLEDLVKEIMSQSLDQEQESQVYTALDRVESHLTRKISGFFHFFMRQEDKDRIQGMIQEIGRAKQAFQPHKEPENEGEARLKFFAELPHKLSVKEAATKDFEAIKLISQKIWDKTQSYADYAKYMTLFYEGEHFLFEEDDQEDNQEFELYDQLRDSKTGAYLRGSSHYDHGTLNGKTGGPVPSQQEIDDGTVENPQYEIEGPQVKALLFGRVKVALDDEDHPIFGKTFEQACEDAKAQNKPLPTKSRKYTFLQTEWAPDSESIFTANYWKHRIFSFVLYVGRKILGFEKPNVGPYGYGHADKGKNAQSNPTTL